MFQVLLVDDDRDHAEQLVRMLTDRNLAVIHASHSREAIAKMRSREHLCDLVILSITDRSQPWLEVLRDLQEADRQVGFEVPKFLCASKLPLGVDLQLQIERMGARYACEE